MKTSDFDYELPAELIAQEPLPRRSDSRMMVLNRASKTVTHASVSSLPEYLDPDDLMVVNNTKVIPARIFGYRKDTAGQVELLLLERSNAGMHQEDGSGHEESQKDTKIREEWVCLIRAGWSPREGIELVLADGELAGVILEARSQGRVIVELSGTRPVMEILEAKGVPPLPPYIKRVRGGGIQLAADKTRYQTVYASSPGAVAAPTAGLHMTPEIFSSLEERGVGKVEVTLHVGIGTFKPVKVDDVTDHVMEEERYCVSEKAADTIGSTKDKGGRVVAVGTTTVRTLETVWSEHKKIVPCSGRSGIFIYPPYEFKAVDALLTNFHLPKSTLIMMVSAFAGREFVKKAYQEAIREKYRFYSYGDCMLIL